MKAFIRGLCFVAAAYANYCEGAETAALQALQTVLEDRAATGWFSGQVAIRAGDDHFVAALGKADLARNLPMKSDTPLSIGSIGKIFVAVSLLQLRLDGKLSFDDALITYIPELTDMVTPELTLTHLLSHTSGLRDVTSRANIERLKGARDNHDLFVLASEMTPMALPGEAFKYTNANFMILGEVIARVSGQQFESYLQEHIFEPAGMNHTRMIRAGNRDAGPIAINYMDLPRREAMRIQFDPDVRRAFAKRSAAGEKVTSFIHEAPVFGGGMIANGAGGTYSTATDMLRFATGLRTGLFVPPMEFEELCTPRHQRESGSRYGLGCVTRGNGPTRSIGHGGGTFGMQSWLLLFPESELELVVMSNHHLQADPIVNAVVEAIQTSSP